MAVWADRTQRYAVWLFPRGVGAGTVGTPVAVSALCENLMAGASMSSSWSG